MSTLLKKKSAKSPPPKAKKKKLSAQKNSQEKFSLKRLLMGEEKPDLTELESGSTTIMDILSPTTVDTKSRDYIVVDGVYHAYLYVTGYGYATTVGSCWLAPLVEAGEGVNLSFIFKRQPKDKILSKIAQNQLATFDQTLYMGCNDLTSAEYISKKCGKVTISVTNNQMPLMPLFSPVYTSTRPYSQTRSSTQRDLMLPDEILRLDRRQCIALFQGRKPALLYKLAPEELPGYDTLKPCKVIDYTPE
ncbi:type IV secretory system conjugative DNA transfer family protein [Oscillospiraceae bacterium 38-13]